MVWKQTPERLSYLFKFKNPGTFRNHLSALRGYFMEILDREEVIKFPKIAVMSKMIPTKKEWTEFYSTLH